MNDIDYEKLRKDLIDYFGTAMFTGVGVATIELAKVEKVSNSELVVIAEKYGFDLEAYKLKVK